AGIAAGLFDALGLGSWPSIYGLSGILIGHVFFNLPLATRLFLEALETVPPDSHRLAAQLGMGARATFRFVDWPALRGALPGVAGLVFMLCMTSFTIVLAIGGGPAATTLEVAIYQSLRFDFDPSRAVVLTSVQLALTALVFAVFARAGLPSTPALAALPVARRRYRKPAPLGSVMDASTIALAALFV